MGPTMLKCSRYSLAVIGFVIGTEIIYKSIRYVCSYLQTNSADENAYCKVIFFPDEGILSGMGSYERSVVSMSESSVANHENCASYPKQSSEQEVPLNADRRMDACNITQHENPFEAAKITGKHKPQNPLCKSTSLIHMINVLDSARRTLSVCVYLITSSDLLDAIIRAKARGVRVRVILDKGMSSVSSVSSLLQNSVPVRYSKPPLMMHNKFAIVDAPENVDYSVNESSTRERKDTIKGNPSAGNLMKNSNSLSTSELNQYSQKCRSASQNAKSQSKDNGILMTGSFNWTWSGVVSNHENVIITNDCNIVGAYAEEFEKLWALFGITVSRN